jgi:hypothetical protein
MKVRKYDDGGVFRRIKKQRRNVAPSNPRFLPSSQMEGEMEEEEEEEEEEEAPRPKVVNRNSLMRRVKQSVSQKRNKAKGRKTSLSCRNPNC